MQIGLDILSADISVLDIEIWGLKAVTEEMIQRLVLKKVKMVKHDQRLKGYHQNRLYRVNQKRFYKEIIGKFSDEKLIPGNTESQRLCSDVWSENKEHRGMLTCCKN